MKQKLIRLRDRLQGLGYHPQLIQLLKLHPKWGFDLTDLWPIQGDNFILDLQELIKTPNMNIPILTRIHLDLQTKKLDKQLIQLHHHVTAIEEETGRADLAIGYPFLSGTLADGTFIQAPLVLYPVQLIRHETYPYQWKLCRLNTEPQINQALLLALQKHHSATVGESVLEDNEYISLATDPSLARWAGWLRSYQVHVTHDEELIEPFHSYSKQSLPLDAPLELKPFLVLANFPLGKTALLQDLQQLMQSVEARTHPLLASLLQQKPIFNRGQVKDPNGTEPFYLLPTDPSQESVLKEARTEPALVVHAPPGSGKSQLVTNLVTDALAQTKKVLVISSRRATLDTVVQQLEKLGLTPYFSQLYDEKADRSELYRKISQLTTKFYSNIPNHEPYLPKIRQKIEEHEQKLTDLHKALHEIQPFGLSVYQLYCQTKPYEHKIDVADIAYSIHHSQLKQIIATLSRYAKYYEKFNKENYILKARHSFADFEDDAIYQLSENLDVMISKSQNLVQRMNDLNLKGITPKYLWSISKDLEQIPIKLKPTDLNIWEKTRLKIWTNFQGKELIQGLSKQINADNKADSWEETSQQLLLMSKISQMSQELNNDLEKLKKVLLEDRVKELQDRLADGDVPIETLKTIRKSLLDDFHQLKEMDRIYQHSTPIVRTLIERLIAYKEIKEFPLGKVWTQMVSQSLYHYWIQTIEEKNPILSIVSSDEIDKIRESYRHLLEEKRKLSQQVLLSDLQYGTNQLLNRYPRELQDLRQQTEKEQNHWSIRKLVHQYYNQGLLEILPVWLVTPEVASTIFPLEKECFDLLIVDEANQCPLEWMIPSVFRCKQMVVIGDDKQILLQPTTSPEEDEGQDEIVLRDPSESLYHAASQVFDKHRLRYHYSSQREELFSFSNHAFYRGKLLIVPNTARLLEQPAIYWQSTAHPEIEAEETIRLLDLLLRKHPNRSIGILSFHEEQKETILAFLEHALQANREFRKRYQQAMEKPLDQRLIIKTVEQAQGIRRDFIILSLGYTKNEQEKIHFDHDPLEQPDGENYLNIAITRAVERLFVLSSIEPEEIDTSNPVYLGSMYFKYFLEYAKGVHNQSWEQVSQSLTEINRLYIPQLKRDSLIEDLIYQELTKRGYTVDRDVGFSSFQVDLAIAHPEQPEQYILGLQCDGTSYRSISNLQEREVHRPRLLEQQGWPIKSVWSRNWWQNPEKLIDEIEEIIDRLTQQNIAIEEIQRAQQEANRPLSMPIEEEQPQPVDSISESTPEKEDTSSGLKIRVETKKSVFSDTDPLPVIEESEQVEEVDESIHTKIVEQKSVSKEPPQEQETESGEEEKKPDPMEEIIATYHWLDQPTPSNDPGREIDYILLFYNNH